MTESEAREKWCPMARCPYESLGRGITAINTARNTYREMETKCMASACMMWRNSHTVNGEHQGYCGLAGKP